MKLATSKMFVLMTFAALLLAAPCLVRADGVNVAVCNPLEAMRLSQEYRDVVGQITSNRKAITVEAETKKNEITQLQQQLGIMMPSTEEYANKNKEVLQKTIEFRVWVELHQRELDRQQKTQTKAMFDKVLAAIKTVAANEKLNLVIADQHADIPEKLDDIEPDVLNRLIVQWNILFHDTNLDITQKVVIELDKQYGPAGDHK